MSKKISLRYFRAFFTPDRLALLLSLLGVAVSYLVADRVFERMPHIEDEVAYVWQARVLAQGQLTIPTPPHPKSYLVPFVVDLNGQRFGKYPPGWPLLLAVAVKLGIRAWLNPLLAGLGVWLTYRLGKRFFSKAVGLLAAGLTVTSPFFLMNSGSLLSHPLGLVLSAVFALAWLELFAPPAGSAPPAGATTLRVWLAGGCLGMLVITRPFSALAVTLPFGLHGLYLLARGSLARLPTDRAVARRVLAVGLITLAFTGVYFGWQKAVTGDALKNPYLLWWPYDEIGFGKGHGVLEEGHNINQALYNTHLSLISGAHDLFGWGALSWIFIPYGLWAAVFGEKIPTGERAAGKRVAKGKRKPVVKDKGEPVPRVNFTRRPYASWLPNRQAWMLFGMVASLVIVYMAYWIGSELYGPRYYYEGLFSLTLLSGAGIAFLAGWRVNPGGEAGSGEPMEPPQKAGSPQLAGSGDHSGLPLRGWQRVQITRRVQIIRRLRAPLMILLVAGLVGYNLAVYLPDRLQEMHGLYGANRDILRNFLDARIFQQAGEGNDQPAEAADTRPVQPALIIVHSEKWHFYGALLELEDPFLTTPFIFAWSMDPTTDAVLHNDFPGRTVYHYYEDDPGVLYRRPGEKE
jgi:hypothetical protein